MEPVNHWHFLSAGYSIWLLLYSLELLHEVPIGVHIDSSVLLVLFTVPGRISQCMDFFSGM